ncbi:MAG: type II toxin-antitoxin system death-on-curing family toxin [Treponema sp.]|nr:type II toxin-antitoxin system death-on-curing family toxin [Treponema sp.]
MVRLSAETIIAIHSELIAESGGLDGVRDNNLLDSSVNSPYHTFGGEYLYPTLQAMGAHLGYSLIKNHPFLDGNKRIGTLVMLVFLELNGLPISCTDEELASLGWGLADGSIGETELIEWIIEHS